MIDTERLRVEADDGSITEYRLADGHLEVRTGEIGEWRRLTASEVSRHIALHTVVDHWLQTKLDGEWSQNSVAKARH
jgi:hypothetical protein